MSRKVDYLIAKYVFDLNKIEDHGFERYTYIPETAKTGERFRIPNYSTSISAAWLVVEKMRKDDMCCFYLEFKLEPDDPMWEAGCKLYMGDHEEFIRAWGTKAEEAICKCFLKARGVKVDD